MPASEAGPTAGQETQGERRAMHANGRYHGGPGRTVLLPRRVISELARLWRQPTRNRLLPFIGRPPATRRGFSDTASHPPSAVVDDCVPRNDIVLPVIDGNAIPMVAPHEVAFHNRRSGVAAVAEHTGENGWQRGAHLQTRRVARGSDSPEPEPKVGAIGDVVAKHASVRKVRLESVGAGE